MNAKDAKPYSNKMNISVVIALHLRCKFACNGAIYLTFFNALLSLQKFHLRISLKSKLWNLKVINQGVTSFLNNNSLISPKLLN